MQQPLNRFLLLQPAWLPTVLFIPLLYALGWLAAVPLTLLGLPSGSALTHRNGAEFHCLAVPPGACPDGQQLAWSEVTKPWAALGILRSQTTGTTRSQQLLFSRVCSLPQGC